MHVHSDASAAIGICRRRGLSKIKHLAASDLWIQDRLRAHDFELSKVLGADNPADALTEFVERNTLLNHLPRVGIRYATGRPDAAPDFKQGRDLSNRIPNSLSVRRLCQL